eukprot:13924616-Alexandrium_andersonii.AAC.1
MVRGEGMHSGASAHVSARAVHARPATHRYVLRTPVFPAGWMCPRAPHATQRTFKDGRGRRHASPVGEA